MLFESTDVNKHEPMLNKLLCGLDPGIPINCTLEISQREKDTMEQMLKGVIQQWGPLGDTSIRGLIDSFLVREGELWQEEDAWRQDTVQKGYDILLDSLPWSYSPVKYAWMKKPLYVKWR
jgi:hypothetical protein